MEKKNDAMQMLNLMTQGAFCVKNGIVLAVNECASKHMIAEGTEIDKLLSTGKREYADFSGGCLYLTLNLSGSSCGASVTRMEQWDVFVLEQDEDQSELQAMALAAQELRQPLGNVMTVADHLFPLTESQCDKQLQDQLSRINRGLFQMLRIISNMSDAYRYCQGDTNRQEIRDICAILDEYFQSIQPMVAYTGLELHYTGLAESIYCLVDAEKLERGVSNILSNAIKFAPKGGTIDVRLTRKGTMLYLSVQDNGSGVNEALRSSVYTRYCREPGLEDSRYGIGLGMVLIRSAAAAHGGTVLMEQNPQWGTRLTMTLAIRQNTENTVRGKILRVDYAGEHDHRLLELSESLPAELYQKDFMH